MPDDAPKRTKPPKSPKIPRPGSKRDTAKCTRVNGEVFASFTVIASGVVATSVMCSGASAFACKLRALPRYQPWLGLPPLTLIAMFRFSSRSRSA